MIELKCKECDNQENLSTLEASEEHKKLEDFLYADRVAYLCNSCGYVGVSELNHDSTETVDAESQSYQDGWDEGYDEGRDDGADTAYASFEAGMNSLKETAV